MTRALVRGLIVAAAIMVAFGDSSAFAQAPSCTISVTSVAFGTYNVFTTTADDSTGTITYRCNSRRTNISIALSDGSSSTFSPRTLTKGRRSPQLQPVPECRAHATSGATEQAERRSTRRANPPNNSNVNLTIYGRIPALQDVSAGNYSDTVRPSSISRS